MTCSHLLFGSVSGHLCLAFYILAALLVVPQSLLTLEPLFSPFPLPANPCSSLRLQADFRTFHRLGETPSPVFPWSVYITVLTFIYWFLLSPYVSVSLTSSDLEAYLTEGLVHRRSSTYVSWLNEWMNGEWCKLFVIEKCILYSAQHWLIPDLIPDSRLIPESIFRGGIWASAFLWSLRRWIWWATRLQITGLIFGIRLK